MGKYTYHGSRNFKRDHNSIFRDHEFIKVTAVGFAGSRDGSILQVSFRCIDTCKVSIEIDIHFHITQYEATGIFRLVKVSSTGWDLGTITVTVIQLIVSNTIHDCNSLGLGSVHKNVQRIRHETLGTGGRASLGITNVHDEIAVIRHVVNESLVLVDSLVRISWIYIWAV